MKRYNPEESLNSLEEAKKQTRIDQKEIERLRTTDEVKLTAKKLQQTIDRVTGNGDEKGFTEEFHQLMNFYNAVILEAGLPMALDPFIGRMVANGIAMGVELSNQMKGVN